MTENRISELENSQQKPPKLKGKQEQKTEKETEYLRTMEHLQKV